LVAAVSLYLLLPTLLSVFGWWRSLSHLEWYFAIPVFAAEGASYACLWELDRIGLGTSGWFAIACAQLAGNAVGRFVPGAPTPFTVEMLRRVGVDTGEAADLPGCYVARAAVGGAGSRRSASRRRERAARRRTRLDLTRSGSRMTGASGRAERARSPVPRTTSQPAMGSNICLSSSSLQYCLLHYWGSSSRGSMTLPR
jgi:hypothetical protein